MLGCTEEVHTRNCRDPHCRANNEHCDDCEIEAYLCSWNVSASQAFCLSMTDWIMFLSSSVRCVRSGFGAGLGYAVDISAFRRRKYESFSRVKTQTLEDACHTSDSTCDWNGFNASSKFHASLHISPFSLRDTRLHGKFDTRSSKTGVLKKTF